MAISFRNSVGLYEDALTMRSQRAQIISSNLANKDTPNYKARDFDFYGALNRAHSDQNHSVNIKRTHYGHLGDADGGKPQFSLQYRSPQQPSIDGNTVEEQVEHAEFMKNSLEFQTAFTLLNSRFTGLKNAFKGE